MRAVRRWHVFGLTTLLMLSMAMPFSPSAVLAQEEPPPEEEPPPPAEEIELDPEMLEGPAPERPEPFDDRVDGELPVDEGDVSGSGGTTSAPPVMSARRPDRSIFQNNATCSGTWESPGRWEDIRPADHVVALIYESTSMSGNYKLHYHRQLSFEDVQKRMACRNSKYYENWYYENPVHRSATRSEVCSDAGCYPFAWSYGPWRPGHVR